MSTRITMVLMTLLVATFAVGCSSPPTERADAARARLEALGPDARTYAPNEFAEAQETVAELEAELEAQQQGFAMSRSYERTEELIDEVDAAAERVESAIEAGRRRAEAEAEAETARQAEIDAQTVAAEEQAAEQAAEASTPVLRPGQVALPRSVNADGKPLSQVSTPCGSGRRRRQRMRPSARAAGSSSYRTDPRRARPRRGGPRGRDWRGGFAAIRAMRRGCLS